MTPWCPKSNRVLLHQLSTHNLVYCIVGEPEGKIRELRTDKILFRPVPVTGNGARVPPFEVVPVPWNGPPSTKLGGSACT